MSDLTYIMSCGCHLKKEELARPGSGKYVCPTHGAVINHKSYICEHCGKTATAHKKTKTPKYCEDCRYEIHLEQSRKSVRAGGRIRNYVLDAKHRGASKKTYDCINRPQCLADILVKDKDAEFLPCHNCDRYTQDEIMSNIRIHGGGCQGRRYEGHDSRL